MVTGSDFDASRLPQDLEAFKAIGSTLHGSYPLIPAMVVWFRKPLFGVYHIYPVLREYSDTVLAMLPFLSRLSYLYIYGVKTHCPIRK